MKTIFLFCLMIFSFQTPKAQEQPVPYTLADRDRLIRLETRMDKLETKMDTEFHSLQKQIDQLSTMFFWGFGILVTLFLFNLGYTIWDRRTAIRPALDKAEGADLKSTGIIRALCDNAKDHPDLGKIFKMHGLL